MNKLLLDLWHDLRAKRLWPVAALLVVALVAIPVALRKHSNPSSSAASPSVSAPTPADSSSKAVVVADTNTSKNSNLGSFSKKNPFRPSSAMLAAAHPPAPSSSSSSAPGGSNGGSGSSGGSAPSSTGGSGGSGGSGGATPTVPSQPKLTFFGYTIDVKFGKFGSEKVHKGVQKLAVLPNQTNPLLVFLGVNSAENTAVFLIDSKVSAAGEGTCKPSPDVCSFLYLKLDSSHNSEELSQQSADGTGTDYSIELLGIHRVPLSQLQKADKAAQKAAAKAQVKARIETTPTPFTVPFGLSLQPDAVG